QVYKYPHQPCKKSLEFDLAQVGHGFVTANGRQRALIMIYKRLRIFSFNHVENVLADIFAHLYSPLRYSGMAFRRFIGYHGSHIANGKNVVKISHKTQFIGTDAVTAFDKVL